MPSIADLRAELKVMRESHPDHMPVSKMKKADVSGAIERMKHLTETTPAIAQTKREIPAMMKPEVVDKAPKEAKVAKVSKAKAPAVEKAPAEKAPAVKESMKDKMAKIRALKKKE